MEERRPPLSAEELRGFAGLAARCARALLEEPSARLVEDLAQTAALAGLAGFDGAEGVSPQRYYDRLFVSTSPYFVPLVEGSVRGAAFEDGRAVYASTMGACADHVSACYRALGFDYRRLSGFEPAVRSLKPDSLASELAFMAFLAQAAAEGAQSDPPASQRAAELLSQFSREHAACWFRQAAACLRSSDDDFYARVAALAARLAESVA